MGVQIPLSAQDERKGSWTGAAWAPRDSNLRGVHRTPAHGVAAEPLSAQDELLFLPIA